MVLRINKGLGIHMLGLIRILILRQLVRVWKVLEFWNLTRKIAIVGRGTVNNILLVNFRLTSVFKTILNY